MRLLILGQPVEIDCADASSKAAVRANYEALASDSASAAPALRYGIERNPEDDGFVLEVSDGVILRPSSLAELVFGIEKDLTVALQRRRPDLLFLHAAVLERHGQAYALVGESGAGKSTTTWGLLHHGFRYLSDELCPVDPRTLEVRPYPHALCLKQRPPPGYPLPTEALDLGRTLHVPVRAMPAAASLEPRPLKALIFVRHGIGNGEPVLLRIGTAEGAARLYVSTLNVLAHPSRGLDAVLGVTRSLPCFALESADLRRTCELVSHHLR